MQPKTKVSMKKIHRTSGSCFVLISKEAVDKLKLKAQDPNCQMVEVVRPPDTLIFKVVHLEALERIQLREGSAK